MTAAAVATLTSGNEQRYAETAAALAIAGIAARMLQHLGRAATSSPFPELTERETEVLGL